MRLKGMLAMAAACWAAAPASAAWLEARTDHFLIYSDSSEQAIRSFASRLERYDKGMRYLHKQPEYPSDKVNPLTIYVVPDADAVWRLCRGSARKSCRDVVGFYVPHVAGSSAFTPRSSGSGGQFDLNAQIVLLHEYAHHFMYRNFSAVYPAWYSEGFAEFNSTASFSRDGAIGFGNPALHRFYGLAQGPGISVKAMMSADAKPLPSGLRESLYGRGWLLTHYLTFTPARAGRLQAYLNALNVGTPGLAAAEAAFGDLDKLDHELVAYQNSRTMHYLRLAPEVVPVGTVAVRQLTDGEAAVMPIRMRSARGVNRQEAAEVALDARKLAAPFPNDAGAQDALAEAEYDAGNDALAEAAADRALAVAPEDMHALLYKGMARMRRAAQAHRSDAATWSDVRGWFIKANRLAPDAAAPLLYFYESYLAQGIAPTSNAVTGLQRAFDVAPQGKELRFLLARQYLRDGKGQEARSLLMPLAFNPHEPASAQAARLIAMIDAGQGKDADALLGAGGEDEGDGEGD